MNPEILPPKIDFTPQQIGAMLDEVRAANRKAKAMNEATARIYETARGMYPAQLQTLSAFKRHELAHIAGKLGLRKRGEHLENNEAADATYIRQLAAQLAFINAEALEDEARRLGMFDENGGEFPKRSK